MEITKTLLKINGYIVTPLVILRFLYVISPATSGINCLCKGGSNYTSICKSAEIICGYDRHHRYFPVQISDIGGWSGLIRHKISFISNPEIDLNTGHYAFQNEPCEVSSRSGSGDPKDNQPSYNHYKEQMLFAVVLLGHIVLIYMQNHSFCTFTSFALIQEIVTCLSQLKSKNGARRRAGISVLADSCSHYVAGIGRCLILSELSAAVVLFAQLALIDWFTEGDFSVFRFFHNLFGTATMDWETEYASSKFPRAINCTFNVWSKDDDSGKPFVSRCVKEGILHSNIFCLIPDNKHNEIFYFAYYLWSVVFCSYVILREMFKLTLLVLGRLKDQYLEMSFTSGLLFPGGMHSYAQLNRSRALASAVAPLSDVEIQFLDSFKVYGSGENEPIYDEFIKAVTESLGRRVASDRL